MKKIAVISLVVLVIGVVIYPSLSLLMNSATGFSAKNICSGYFVSHFSEKTIVNESLRPVSGFLDRVNVDIDVRNYKVNANVFGFFQRIAVYQPGIGCTLLAPNQKTVGYTYQSIKAEINHKDEIESNNLNNSIDENIVDIELLTKTIDGEFEEIQQNISKNTKAIVVLHDGKLIAEKYAKGINPNTPLQGWGLAKSVINMQIGILVNQGKLNINEPVNLPIWNKPNDSRSVITIDHLLRMSSGLEFEQRRSVGSDTANILTLEADAGSYSANKDLSYTPDTHWSYSSGSTMILSKIIREVIGGSFQNYYQFIQSNMFKPLEISSAQLEHDAVGTFMGSSYMYASARDWAKLGQLYLQNGKWQGNQILPKTWVNYTISPSQTDPLNHYGAHFWLNRNPVDKTKSRLWKNVPSDAYYMSGYLGQKVVVIPSKSLVVVRIGSTTPGTDDGVESMLVNIIQSISK